MYATIYRFKNILVLGVVALTLLGAVGSALANTPKPKTTQKTTAAEEMGKQFGAVNSAAGFTDPEKAEPRLVVARIIRTILNFLGIIFLAFIVYAGFVWMTAAGNEDAIEKAKKIIYRSVIGLIIILAAQSITWAAFKIALNYQDGVKDGLTIN